MQKSEQGLVLRFSNAFAKVQTSQEENQWCWVNKQGSNIDITRKASPREQVHNLNGKVGKN